MLDQESLYFVPTSPPNVKLTIDKLFLAAPAFMMPMPYEGTDLDLDYYHVVATHSDSDLLLVLDRYDRDLCYEFDSDLRFYLDHYYYPLYGGCAIRNMYFERVVLTSIPNMPVLFCEAI